LPFATAILPGEAFSLIRSYVPQYKAAAQDASATLAATSINTDYVFNMLDRLREIVVNLTSWKSVAGLDAYATADGYPTTISTDCTAIVTAAQNCIDWVVTNFPSSGGFLLDNSLNADGSRTPRSFSSAQTAGLRTRLNALVATIG